MIRAGGYLTPLVRHRLVEEYVGEGAGTVCEDMEIVVRLHRFVRDKLRDRRVAGRACQCCAGVEESSQVGLHLGRSGTPAGRHRIAHVA